MTLPTKIENALHAAEHVQEVAVHDVTALLHPIRTAVGETLTAVGTDVRAALDAQFKALEPTLTAEAKLAVEAIIKAGVEALIMHGI